VELPKIYTKIAAMIAATSSTPTTVSAVLEKFHSYDIFPSPFEVLATA
jgi:hypothetical protein